ncbi:DUF4097 domain-containing protein [Paenarthrobacter sp. MSM-2-10-13]|uniref:DUF4097 family beta strand repeat-containing protein n=1 Tax=Micrococcaceae TaxID=1268 RepID=UPI00115D10BA|nr:MULTISPECIES: DUF4097 family beta strand repeat-containing protein [Micrococcaceae]MCM0615359.1 DUF4097 domain-containing protein [Paenarthrobacter sp. TYUT067]NHW47490.1 DUF4097 domain-containing protein [Paenarthrobacter sp. MSM-2-10-13]TQS92713.1 hypothetical protein EU811_08880 [Arthrobacter sp. TS-15]BCW64312.1 hypothetical protein StoSoilB22_32850 [Arthrobacter sp. StoSoilB22]
MATFQTPQPIAVVIDVSVRGDIQVVAQDRHDTEVTVQPRKATRNLDVKMAEQTTVDYSDGRLQVRLHPSFRHSWFSDGGAVEITVEVPTGSSLELKSAMGDLRCEGEFGAADLKTDLGHIRVDHCGELRAHTDMGDITVEHAVGRSRIKTGSGKIRIHHLDGVATVKNGNGNTYIAHASGELSVSAANGDISLERAGLSTTVKTSSGDVTVGEVAAGSLTVQTAAGTLAVGVSEGTAAWLDLSTKYGRVRNALEATNGPGDTVDRVEIRARNAYGDIAVMRSPVSAR